MLLKSNPETFSTTGHYSFLGYWVNGLKPWCFGNLPFVADTISLVPHEVNPDQHYPAGCWNSAEVIENATQASMGNEPHSSRDMLSKNAINLHSHGGAKRTRISGSAQAAGCVQRPLTAAGVWVRHCRSHSSTGVVLSCRRLYDLVCFLHVVYMSLHRTRSFSLFKGDKSLQWTG